MNIVLTQTPPPPRFDSYRPVNLTGKIRPAPVFSRRRGVSLLFLPWRAGLPAG